jgi:carbamoyl-phosphate synthase small subunit
MNIKLKDAKIVLENGDIFYGKSPEYQQKTVFGEFVFNTGMTGYEETLTDPSYSGQVLTFTYPIIGNYGVSDADVFESDKIHVKGIICQSLYTHEPKHYAKSRSFLDWLAIQNTPIIFGVDCKALTKVIRDYGVINGAMVFNDECDIDKQIKANIKYSKVHWVEQVSCKTPTTYGSGKYNIILVDCGYKKNILRNLLKFDVTVKVVPFNYDYTKEDYDGVFLSNGPGDPKLCIDTINILKNALSKVEKPIYGICLGAQLMSLAIGADTYKLKFGHRGQNQPCLNLLNGRSYLTSQNHGYAVDELTLPKGWLISYRNLNDNTVAGIMHNTKPFAATQFHPEASPGPHDTFYFFEQFFESIKKVR